MYDRINFQDWYGACSRRIWTYPSFGDRSFNLRVVKIKRKHDYFVEHEWALQSQQLRVILPAGGSGKARRLRRSTLHLTHSLPAI